ncbi:sensor domain-containing diguanylate cyclase [Methylophaga sp. OBS4]|uniref:sensor domain-containing diguanylate cyclase n=1 Tax=Methylophaga sp. OBS4 TaxID=2991935 RepID=UPI00224D8866|nr:sensor domain-containing diguanylate cyclase [Methylophaga sp. OBS4]MCX4186545.1 sensor domain-containing diguanylate cyclase [Methylophaga sp. OBS4]
MSEKHEDQGRDVIKQLRSRTAQLEELRAHINGLENQCMHLQDSAHQLAEKLIEYSQIEEEWEWFFEHSVEMLCIAGTDGYFKRVNAAFANNLGYTKQELTSCPFIDFVHPDDRQRTQEEFRALQHGHDTINFENRYRDSEGHWHWLSWHCPAVTPSMTKLFAVAHDMTERKRSDEDMLYKALHDPLTGLFNRAAFEEQLSNAIARVKRLPGDEIALYLIDLDGFKHVNDTYGHMAGDQLLKQLSARFKKIKRENEFVCRYGGDEFAWLAEESGAMKVEPLAERIMASINQPIKLEKATVRVSCCVGISIFPRQAIDASTLMSQADAAMYSVKKNGKSGYKIFKY